LLDIKRGEEGLGVVEEVEEVVVELEVEAE